MLATRRQVKPPLWVKGGRAFHLSACVARGRCCPDSCRGGRVGRHGRVGPEPDSFTATNATVFRSPRRRDRAALRLITSSNLGGNCTVVPGYSNKRKFGRGLKCRWAKELCRARARRGAARARAPRLHWIIPACGGGCARRVTVICEGKDRQVTRRTARGLESRHSF